MTVALEDGAVKIWSHVVSKWNPVDYQVDEPDALYVFSSPFHSILVFEKFREHCPWSCHADNPDLVPVSDDLVRRYADHTLKDRLDLLRIIRESGYAVAVAESPKPFDRPAGLLGTRPDVARAVDDLYRRHVTKRLAEIDVPVIPAPAESHRDGFTLPDYRAADEKDSHHGNGLFAQAAMRDIRAFAACR